MGRFAGVLSISLIVLIAVVSVEAQGTEHLPEHSLSPERLIQDQWNRLPLEPLDSFVYGLDPDLRDHLPPLDVWELVFNRESVQWSGIGRALIRFLWAEVAVNFHLLSQLVVLGIFCALLQVMATTIGGGSGTTDLAFFMTLLVLLLLGLKAFQTGMDVALTTLNQIVNLLQALLPVMSMMLAAVGAVSSAAIFHPMIYATVTGVVTVVQTLFFPLIFISATLAVIGSISEQMPLKNLEGLLKTGAMFLLGFLFIAFFAVVQVRGVVAPVADGFAIRTVKFLTSTFIPVVGGRVAEAMDVVVGGSVLIKNAVGFFGMVTVLVVTLFPIIKILALFIVFKVAAVLIEPITDARFVRAMTGLAGGMGLLAAGVITAALMFFVGITVLVSVGNTAAVMR